MHHFRILLVLVCTSRHQQLAAHLNIFPFSVITSQIDDFVVAHVSDIDILLGHRLVLADVFHATLEGEDSLQVDGY